MSASASITLPTDLVGFLQGQQRDPKNYEAIYKQAEGEWGKEKFRYDLHTSRHATKALAVTTGVAFLAFLYVQGYQLATYCKPTKRFTHLPLKKYLLASTFPVAVVIGCLKLADWVDNASDPLFVAGIRWGEKDIFRRRVREGKINLMAYLLHDCKETDVLQAQRIAKGFGQCGIFPKEQCAKTAVLMEAFSSQQNWDQFKALSSEEQPKAVRNAVQAAKQIWPISQ